MILFFEDENSCKRYQSRGEMKLREGVKNKINYLARGTPIRLNNKFFHTKIRAIQTVLNCLKHEKNQ